MKQFEIILRRLIKRSKASVGRKRKVQKISKETKEDSRRVWKIGRTRKIWDTMFGKKKTKLYKKLKDVNWKKIKGSRRVRKKSKEIEDDSRK